MPRLFSHLTAILFLTTLASACAPGATGGADEPRAPMEQWRVDPDAHVKLWVPAGWTVEDGPGEIIMTEPHGEVAMRFAVIDAADLGAALLDVGARVLTEVDDVALDGAPGELTVNGMSGLYQDGKGTIDGVAVDLGVGVLDTPSDKFLLVVGAADSAHFDAHEAEIKDILDHIQPAE